MSVLPTRDGFGCRPPALQKLASSSVSFVSPKTCTVDLSTLNTGRYLEYLGQQQVSATLGLYNAEEQSFRLAACRAIKFSARWSSSDPQPPRGKPTSGSRNVFELWWLYSPGSSSPGWRTAFSGEGHVTPQRMTITRDALFCSSLACVSWSVLVATPKSILASRFFMLFGAPRCQAVSKGCGPGRIPKDPYPPDVCRPPPLMKPETRWLLLRTTPTPPQPLCDCLGSVGGTAISWRNNSTTSNPVYSA